jgi:tyrosyl-tRNA synthetase
LTGASTDAKFRDRLKEFFQRILTMNVFNEFEWRGMVYDVTEGLPQVMAKEKITGYIGFDPSASSLHVGSFLPIMGLVHMQRFGHTPIAIVGGGTGLIGDPSGKTLERPLMTKEEVETNLLGIREQLSRFLDFNSKTNPAIMVNNADWLCTISLLDFLRDVGKYFSVNYMIAKESVKRRLEQEEGISFTEFSYLILQAYDFLVLYDRYNCTLQLGGSDQWGNITAGTDLIRRLRGGKAYGLVFPLVTTTSGIKFGKTELGTVWLDAKLTSPFRFYQFWINTDDKDAITYLKFFTLLSQSETQGLAQSLTTHPEKREAQRKLAREATRMVHGDTELSKAERASRVLFGEEISSLSLQDVLDIFADVPSSQMDKSRFSGDGITLVDLLISSELAQSKSKARRLIQGGGIYLNNLRVADIQRNISLADSIEGQVFILRKGSKEYRLVQVIPA